MKEVGGRVVGANPGEWSIDVDNRTYLAVRGTINNESDEQTKYITDFWNCVDGHLKYD